MNKTKHNFSLISIIILVLLNANSGTAQVILEENFEVVNRSSLSNWIFDAYGCVDLWSIANCPSLISIENTMYINNGTLAIQNHFDLEMHRVIHESNIAYGTWEFGWFIRNKSLSAAISIGIIAVGEDKDYDYTGRSFSKVNPSVVDLSYSLHLAVENNIILMRFIKTNNVTDTSNERTEYLNSTIISEISDVSGWHAIEITRDSSGQFEVFFNRNSVLKAQDQDEDAYTTSNFFSLTSLYGESTIDNVQIRDTESSARFYFPRGVLSIGGGIFIMGISVSGLVYIRNRRLQFQKLNNNASKTVKNTVLNVFKNNPEYYYLVAQSRKGASPKEDETVYGKKLDKIRQYQVMLHPVRLSIMKLLHENVKIVSSEVRRQLSISWPEFTNNVKPLVEMGYLSLMDEFVEARLMQVVYLEEHGKREFEIMSLLLADLLDTMESKNIPNQKDDDKFNLYPTN